MITLFLGDSTREISVSYDPDTLVFTATSDTFKGTGATIDDAIKTLGASFNQVIAPFGRPKRLPVPTLPATGSLATTPDDPNGS